MSCVKEIAIFKYSNHHNYVMSILNYEACISRFNENSA